MRVVIVDDEGLERKAMRQFVEEHFHDLEVVGEASNGRLAIELADQVEPDVMFMDITMPGINGLEAIEIIRERNPAVKFIIVSAYDSFDYAKKAMKEGVKEYLLKPSKKEDVVEAILRVRNEITEEKRSRKKQRQSLDIERENFLLKILQYDEPIFLKKQQEKLFPNMAGGFFFVMDNEGEHETSEIQKTIETCSPFPVISVQNSHLLVSLFIYTKEQIEPDLISLAKEIVCHFQSDLWTGIGHCYSEASQLHQSYQEALQTVHRLKKNKGIRYSLPMKKLPRAEESLIEDFMSLLIQGNFSKAWDVLKDRLEDLDSTELYVKIRENLIHLGITVDHLFFPETRSHWRDLIQSICAKMADVHLSNQPIEKAKAYIHKHFQEPITLEEVAETVRLSPTYFTKLFREAVDTTFIDYVTELRLSKAKQLLLENELSLKEISYMIGYRDPNYFSRVFKRRFKQSPKQFQKKCLIPEK